MKACILCGRSYPMFMFRRSDYFSRDGKLHRCRLCSISEPVRYRKVRGTGMFPKMEPYPVTVIQRIKEFFHA